jgi:hypothetical protein
MVNFLPPLQGLNPFNPYFRWFHHRLISCRFSVIRPAPPGAHACLRQFATEATSFPYRTRKKCNIIHLGATLTSPLKLRRGKQAAATEEGIGQ